MEARAISIGILEDDCAFNDYLCMIINAAPDFELLFSAMTLASAIRATERALPDIMLVDMQLPDGLGLELVRKLAGTPCRTLLLTILAGRDSLFAALDAGAHGYLLKDTLGDRILESLKLVHQGQAPISPAVAAHLVAALRKAPSGDGPPPTSREREVIAMIARGLTYAEAAATLGISVHTVGDHIKSIYRKLDVGSKSEAIFEARQQGWLRITD